MDRTGWQPVAEALNEEEEEASVPILAAAALSNLDQPSSAVREAETTSVTSTSISHHEEEEPEEVDRDSQSGKSGVVFRACMWLSGCLTGDRSCYLYCLV